MLNFSFMYKTKTFNKIIRDVLTKNLFYLILCFTIDGGASFSQLTRFVSRADAPSCATLSSSATGFPCALVPVPSHQSSRLKAASGMLMDTARKKVTTKTGSYLELLTSSSSL